MPLRPRHSVHPGIARMGGSAADAAACLAEAAASVQAMYATRAALRPLHQVLEQLALALDDDTRLCPGETTVPVYRRHVIAQIKPATKTRIDLGLALGGLKGKGRLLETGGYAKRDRITHRIAVSALEEIDAESRQWLRRAYDADA